MQYNHHPLGSCVHGNLGATCETCPHTHPEISRPLWIALIVLGGFLLRSGFRKTARHKNPTGRECRYEAFVRVKSGGEEREHTTSPYRAKSLGAARELAQDAIQKTLKPGQQVTRLKISHVDC